MSTTKKILIMTIVVMGITVILGALPIHGESEIYDSVVRLHVLANSDSDEDQSLKLKVRDEILAVIDGKLDDCRARDEAAERINQMIPEIKSAAQSVVAREGYDYGVEVILDLEEYPTREYESCAFPAGEYLSLRVLIGSGEGQNWWCCLFPPLCLSSASKASQSANEDAFIAVGLTGEQYKIITETDTPKYKARFKILEVFKTIFD